MCIFTSRLRFCSRQGNAQKPLKCLSDRLYPWHLLSVIWHSSYYMAHIMWNIWTILYESYDMRGSWANSKGTELITLRRADNDISEDDDDSYKPGPYWSLMLEISEGPLKEISNSTLVEQVKKRFRKKNHRFLNYIESHCWLSDAL